MLDVKDPTVKAEIAFAAILVAFFYVAPFVADAIGAKAAYAVVMIAIVAWLGYRAVGLIRGR